MTVSFTGVKNTGFIKIVDTFRNQEGQVFTTQLVDDFRGKDLAEFKKAMSKSDVADCSYSGQISLYTIKQNPISEYEYPKYDFYLNGKNLERKDKNLPMFDFLAKLTRKINSQEKTDMVVEKDFIEGSNVRFGMLPGVDMKLYFEKNLKQNYEDSLKSSFDKNNAKRGAKIINESIHESMLDYFDC